MTHVITNVILTDHVLEAVLTTAQMSAQPVTSDTRADGTTAIERKPTARGTTTRTLPTTANVTEVIAAAAKNPEKWEQLKQDFPEWAGAMEEYVAAKIGGQQQQGISPEAVAQFVQQQVPDPGQVPVRVSHQGYRPPGKWKMPCLSVPMRQRLDL
jgi:hypothetical protein